MRYWDASALVPLVLVEDTTTYLERLTEQHTIVTWWFSDVEIASAIERRTREGRLDSTGRARALSTLATLAATWTEVSAVSAVRERAYRLLATHALRAADAVQLAAALVATADRPRDHEFIALDVRLRESAQREGFTVLDPRHSPRD